MTPLAVTVEFLADGRCVVDDAVARRLQPSGSDFRCPLPHAASGADPIALRVVLPAGTEPSPYVFPRLDWSREASGWIGTATLPSSPAFVSLHAHRAPIAGGFGWNFYGFFVFAAAFIATYFAWARWMQRRDRARAR